MDIGAVVLPLAVLIAVAQILGYVFARMRQPRVIGEILAGVLLGPAVFGNFAPQVRNIVFAGGAASAKGTILDFVYWMGLLFLMFVSGTETRSLFSREDRRQVTWLTLLGTGVPFLLALVGMAWLPYSGLIGSAQQPLSFALVIAIAVAVTSIPVISRIFFDLKILHTRFARLVLNVAVIEDIALWGVLAVATALAKTGNAPKSEIARHIAASLIYFAVGLFLAPPLLKRLNSAQWNLLAKASPIAYLVAILFGYTAVAAVFDVNLVFAAFLAGFAVASDKEFFLGAIESLTSFSFAVFVAPYFAMVGLRLDLSRAFSWKTLVLFLSVACVIKLLGVSLGARLAGFRGLDVINLSVATNARGGPGIVLASVALDAGIITASFYTTLVLVAILTSQAAGAWLEFVLRKGWPLLSAGDTVLATKPRRSTVVDVTT